MQLGAKYWCLIACISIVAATDYCRKGLCNNDGEHIGCGNNNKIASECVSFSEMLDLSSIQQEIVDAHNNYRNQIASGKVSGYKQAVNMSTMVWDKELAYLAGLNVKTCKFSHDKCRNTDHFKYSGQNLAYSGGYPDPGMKTTILSGIKRWFDENKNGNMNTIDKFSMGSSRKQTGHFTVMVIDNNNRVGCAAIRKNKGRIIEYVTACNYAKTNIIGGKIYKSGKVASECKTGRNPIYPGLCSMKEAVNPNVV